MLEPTSELVSRQPPMGRSFADVLKYSSGSAAGFHANSEWLTCPERSRLRSLGIEFRGYGGGVSDEISALDFGTLIHELLAMRVWHGHDAAMQQLDMWRPELGEASHLKAALMLGTYEQTFPLAHEALKFLGVECEVVTDIGMASGSCFRSVRYDGIVLASGGIGTTPQLYSLERKTMSRSGASALHAYYPQGMVQMALWNANAALVERYGKMQGIIYESLVKTKTPNCDRTPVYFSEGQQRLALQYMRLAENGGVQFQKQEDGRFPKLLHSCWGKFAPCSFIQICHDQEIGAYTKHGQDLTELP